MNPLPALLLALVALLPTAQAQTLNLRILGTTDVHMNLVKPLQPGQVHAAYEVMNAMGYDAADIGNHEFNFGPPFLRQSLTGAGFPYVNSNVYIDDGSGNLVPQDIAESARRFVPAVMPGFWGSHLGVIDLVLDKTGDTWRVRDGRAHLRPIWDRDARKPLVAADTDLLALIQAEHAGTLAYLGAAVAQTRTPTQTYFARVADDPSVQLVSLAQLAWARRALQGTPHAGLPLLSAAAPFRTGAQVREWLEMSAIAFNRIDLTQPARYERSGKRLAPDARRIVDLRIEGKPIDPAARFVVVSNNYRASAGGNFPGLDGDNIVLVKDNGDGTALFELQP